MGVRKLCSTCCLLVTLAFTFPAAASQLIPRSLPELATGSQVIFVGRCEAVSSHWNDDRTLILTTNRFRVLRGIKGAPGSTFIVTELGGQVGDTTLQVSDIPRFAVGEEVLLCVRRTPLGRWETFGAVQGKFEVVRDARGRAWARSGFYRSQLAAMAPEATPELGAPLSVLAGRLSSTVPVHGVRP
jgi:hypothetical protein